MTGKLDPDEDKEHDAWDDGQSVGAVNAASDVDATPAGDQGERGDVGTLLRQHGERPASVGRRRTGVPAADSAGGPATAGSRKCQTGNACYFPK